jgi:hypothetical protein
LDKCKEGWGLVTRRYNIHEVFDVQKIRGMIQLL